MEKKLRPKELEGRTFQKTVGCGHIYITVSRNGAEGPFEVFAKLGKAGGCSSCQNEALTRAVTLGLRYGIPVQEYIDELRGIQCPNPHIFPKEEKCLSCADAIAQALVEFIGSKAEEAPKQAGLPCPECGAPMYQEEGCSKCLFCGYSECN